MTGLLFVVALVALLQVADAQGSNEGQAGSKAEEFFIWEFLGGAIGGALSSQTVVSELLSSWCKAADDPGLCQRVGRAALRPIAYPLFVFAGTTLSITAVGLMNQVEGNLVAATIGSFAGAWGGLVEALLIWSGIDWLLSPGREEELISPETPEFLKLTIPYIIELLRPYEALLKEVAIVFFPTITSAFWGTVGFNVGARIKSPAH